MNSPSDSNRLFQKANENRNPWLLISLPVEEPILRNWMNEKVMTETKTTLVISKNNNNNNNHNNGIDE